MTSIEDAELHAREVKQRLRSLIDRHGPRSGGDPAQFARELWDLPRADLAGMVVTLVAALSRAEALHDL